MSWRKVASDGMPIGVVRFSGGMSNLGNTVGTTGTVQNNLVLAATGQYSLSQSQSSTGATVTLAGDGYASIFGWNTAAFYNSATAAFANASEYVYAFDVPYQVSFTRLDIPMTISLATTAADATAQMNLSAVAILYTRQSGRIDGGLLLPFLGASSVTTYTWDSSTGVYSSLTGPRIMSFPLATQLSAGQYYLGLQFSSVSTQVTVGSATTALNGTLGYFFGNQNTGNWADMMGGIPNNQMASAAPILAWRVSLISSLGTVSSSAFPFVNYQSYNNSALVFILRNI